MIHKHRLVNLEQKQSTGQLMRLWREQHMTGPLLPVVALPLEERDTQELAVLSPPQRYSMPRFVDYRAASYHGKKEDCLAMLYSACLLAIDSYNAIPGELFVSSALVPHIVRHTQKVCGVSYNGRYRIFAGGDLHHIPIRTEEFLPPIIKLAVADRLHTDQVIGLIDC